MIKSRLRNLIFARRIDIRMISFDVNYTADVVLPLGEEFYNEKNNILAVDVVESRSSCSDSSEDTPQIYTRDHRTCAIFWWSLGFPMIKYRGLSGAYVTCMYYILSVKTNTRKTPHGAQRSGTNLFCVCFCVCGLQKN